MCENKDCQHKKESPIKDWKHRCKFGPDGRRLHNGTVIAGWNDMATTHPWLAKECLDDATKFQAGSNKQKRWKCKVCKYEWPAQPSKRALRGDGCGCCSNRVCVPGVNDLATTHPHLAEECLDDPASFTAGSRKSKRWKCKVCKFEWPASPSKRALRGDGCRCCSGKICVKGVNDCATTHPYLVEECLDKLTDVTAGSAMSKRWRCKVCGFEWSLPVKKRALRGDGCGCCSNRVCVPGVNDLATTHPEHAKELVGDPTKVVAGTNKSLRWRCSECGYKYKKRGSSKIRTQCACCTNQVCVAGINDMATTHPRLAADCIDDPRKYVAKTNKLLRWCCSECGKKWKATGNRRVADDGVTIVGCSNCADSGFKTNKPSFIYLISRGNSLKVGIGNYGSGRLAIHRRQGWAVVDLIDLIGELAKNLEKIIKDLIKEAKIPTGRKAFLAPFDGWTEAWPKEHLSPRSIRGLCRKLGIDLDAFLAA